MKTKFATLLIAGLIGIAASSSASLASTSERPDSFMTGLMAEKTKTISADQIYSSKELARSGYDADTKVQVTVFASSGKIDKSSARD